ncbi:TPA: hypothetical protein ACH3X1_000784 [Trebouxia sp. C0004]
MPSNRPPPRIPDWLDPIDRQQPVEHSHGKLLDGIWGSNISPTSKVRGRQGLHSLVLATKRSQRDLASTTARVLDFQSCHKERLFRDSASSPRLHSRVLSQKEVVGHDQLRTVSSLHLPMASWSPTSTLRAQPASRLQVADTPSPAVGTSTVFDHQYTVPTPDHQQIAVYRPPTHVAPLIINAATLSSVNISPISSDAGSDSTAGSRMFEWQVLLQGVQDAGHVIQSGQLAFKAGSHSPVSPMTQPLTAMSVLAPQSTLACTPFVAQLQHPPPNSHFDSQSRAASGDSRLQVHLLPSAITSLDKRHASTPDRAELQNDPDLIAAVAHGAFVAQANPATNVVKENPAAQAEPATTAVQENPAAQADPAATDVQGPAAQADPATTVVKENPAAQAEPATTAVQENPAGQADPATTDVQQDPAAQADLATTVVQENPVAQANLGTAARQRVASLTGCSSCESATHEHKSSVWSKGDELQVDEASSKQRHAAATDGHLQQRIGTADSAALDAAGLQPLMQEQEEDHVAGMPAAAVLLRQHSYIQQAANMAPAATATISPTAEGRCDAVVGSQICADSLHEEHGAEAPLHGHLALQQSHAFSKAVLQGGDKGNGQISHLPEAASQSSTPAHQPHVHAHQASVSAHQLIAYARQVSMSALASAACQAALANQQTVPAHQLSSSACQLSMRTNQQDAPAHMQSFADQAQTVDSAAGNQQVQQQQKQNVGFLRVSSASFDHAKGAVQLSSSEAQPQSMRKQAAKAVLMDTSVVEIDGQEQHNVVQLLDSQHGIASCVIQPGTPIQQAQPECVLSPVHSLTPQQQHGQHLHGRTSGEDRAEVRAGPDATTVSEADRNTHMLSCSWLIPSRRSAGCEVSALVQVDGAEGTCQLAHSLASQAVDTPSLPDGHTAALSSAGKSMPMLKCLSIGLASGIREESADTRRLSAQQSLQQDQLPGLDHPTSESLQANPELDEAQQKAAAGAAEKLPALASNLSQQSLASTEDSQTAQAEECQAAAYAQDGHAASAEDIAPAAEAGHVQEAQADQPASQSSLSLDQLQMHSTEVHVEPEPAFVDLRTSQQFPPDATAAGASMPFQQVLESQVTVAEADAEALNNGSVGMACAEAHDAEVGECFVALASLTSDAASELKASLGQQVFSNVRSAPGTRKLDSGKGEAAFADGQLGPDKGQPEVDDGQPNINNQSGLPTLQSDVNDGLPGLHSEQLAPSVEQQTASVEQLQGRPEQPLLCIVQADAVGRQPDADNLTSTQSEPRPGSLLPQIPANLQMLKCVQDHQHQLVQSQQRLPAVSAVSSSHESHADAQRACMSPFQLPDRLSVHEPAALQSQLSEALASALESHVSTQANISPFQLTQGFATHESAALQSQLSEALASSTSELPLLYPEVERHNGEGLSPQRLCSQLLSHLSVQHPGLQLPDSFLLQPAEAIPRSASALLQLYPGLEQVSSDVTQGLRQPCQSLSCSSRQQPGLEQPDSFQRQSVVSLSRSVPSPLQLYPGLEQPGCNETSLQADDPTKNQSTWMQVYPGLERPGTLQSQQQSEPASRSRSGVLQVDPSLEQQYQHTQTAVWSIPSVLQVYPGLEQLGQQKMTPSASTLSAPTLEPPLQQCSRLESAAVKSAQQALGDKADQLLQPLQSVALSSQFSNMYPTASSCDQDKQQEGTQRAQHAQQDGFPPMQEAAVDLTSRQWASENHVRNAKQTAMMQGKAEQVPAIPPATVPLITAGQPRWGCTDAATQLSLLRGLAASSGTASVMRNAAAAAAFEEVAVIALESVAYTMPHGQAAIAQAAEPAAEAVEEAATSPASVGPAQEAVTSAAGAEAVQEAVESHAGPAHASGAEARRTADNVIEASMLSTAEGVAGGGRFLQPPQPDAGAAINSSAEASSGADLQQALVQAFTQACVQRAIAAGTSLTSTAPEHDIAAVSFALNKALNTDDLQRGNTASEHKLAATGAVASADSTACPAADMRGTAGSAAASATAAPISNSDGTAAIAAPASATPESGSTAAHLASADETAAASMVDAAVHVTKPGAHETAAASTVDAAVDVSKPSATDAAKLDALHHAGAGPAKLQLMGQDDVPHLAGSGTGLRGGKATLVSHYAAALQTMLAQSFPPPTTPTRSQSSLPSWDPDHHTVSSSFSPPDLFDLGSNPHLTPRYSQGASHQLASASSHPCDVIQPATLLPSFWTTTHSFGQLPSAMAGHVQRQICSSPSGAVLGGRARLTSEAASIERMPQRAHAAHTNIPSQARRLSTRQSSAVATRQHQQCTGEVADLAGHSSRASSHGMQSAAAGRRHLALCFELYLELHTEGTSAAVTPVASSSPDNLPQGNTVLPCSSLQALPAAARMQGGTARALERMSLYLR